MIQNLKIKMKTQRKNLLNIKFSFIDKNKKDYYIMKLKI